MTTKKIFIDAGHGGSDPGAVKYVTESKVNIKVANYMADYLEKTYICSVKKDISANTLPKICGDANRWDADLFISIHFNAGRGDGFEVWVYSKKNEALGEAIEKQVKKIGQNSRGVKIDPELIVLNSTNMKAALVECAFVDNWKDIKDWDENSELKEMGEAIAKGVADYLDLPRKKGKYYTVGETYTLQANVKVRTGASTKYRQKKRSELTAEGRKGSLNQTYAVLKKGERVTCLQTSNDGKWIRIPSGWICGREGDKIYIK